MVLCEAEATYPNATDQDPNRSSAPPSHADVSLFTRDCADIMGVLIDRTRRDRVLAQIDAFVQTGRPHQVVTVNVDFLSIVHQDPAFVRLLNDAAISVPDGMPLVWLSRLIGQALPERITGTDLLCGCAELAARQGYRLFLLGAAPGVADEAAALLQARYAGLQVAGTYAPPEQGEFSSDEDARILEKVRAARPDLLFVALGTPKQEKWIYRNLDQLGVPVCIGVGGVFNFITGRIPRAPEAMQRAGLEWLFRLLLEPRRLWRRYLLDDSRALCRAVSYAVRTRRTRRAAPPRRDAEGRLLPPVAVVPGRPLVADTAEWHLPAMEAAAPAPPLVADTAD